MKDSDPHKRAYAAALRFITLRPRSESEVRNRLARQFPPEVIATALHSLKSEGLLDDALYARLWTESRVSRHPRSGRLIKRELMSKGVASDLASDVVREIDDVQGAYLAGSKQARKIAATDLPTFQRRLWSYLQRRGFSDSLSRSTTMRLWREIQDGLGAESQEET